MKFLKYLLYVLLALVVIGILLGLIGPKTYDISRSAVVSGTPEQVWPYLSSFPKAKAWSPFLRMDPTITAEYAGEEGKVGSKLIWKSKKMGGGEQTIVALEPYKSIDSELLFLQPWGEGHATTYYHLQDTVGGTKVTWAMHGENGFVNRAMGALMNMDKMMGPIFLSGLASLDSLVKASPKEMTSAYSITPGEYPGGEYLGIRKQVKISGLTDFFSQNFPKVIEGAKKSGAEIGMPSGVYYTWEPEKDNTDVAAAVGVRKAVKAPAGLTAFSVPAAKSLTIDYMGGYSGMGGAHDAMDAYMKSNNLTQIAPVLEEYVTGPMAEPDSMKWHTRIVYLVK